MITVIQNMMEMDMKRMSWKRIRIIRMSLYGSIWWSGYDDRIIIWWWYDNDMMIWWWFDDAITIVWWWYGVHKNEVGRNEVGVWSSGRGCSTFKALQCLIIWIFADVMMMMIWWSRYGSVWWYDDDISSYMMIKMLKAAFHHLGWSCNWKAIFIPKITRMVLNGYWS